MAHFGIWTIGKGRLAVIALLALLVVGCGQATASSAPPGDTSTTPATQVAQADTPTPAGTPAATTSVVIEDFAFSPATITVPAGSIVTWTNNDVEQHTVTARDRGFNSDAIADGQSFQFTFSKAGTYEYFCQIHPHMVGRVIVTAA